MRLFFLTMAGPTLAAPKAEALLGSASMPKTSLWLYFGIPAVVTIFGLWWYLRRR